MKKWVRNKFLNIALRLSYDKRKKAYVLSDIKIPAGLEMTNIKVMGNAIMNTWSVDGEVQRMHTLSKSFIDQSGCIAETIIQDLHRHPLKDKKPKVTNHKDNEPIIQVELEKENGKAGIKG